MRFGFRQMKNEDISVFIDEMFEILASNMSAVAPTGNSYDEDYKTWSEKRSTCMARMKAQCNSDFLRR